MHAVFLYHAIQKGMDFGIVNPSSKVTYDDIPKEQLQLIEDVVLNRHPESADQLMGLEDTTQKTDETGEIRVLSLEERLQEALIKGPLI